MESQGETATEWKDVSHGLEYEYGCRGTTYSYCMLAVGILVFRDGVAMGAGQHRGDTGSSEPDLARTSCQLPWADCNAGTSELFGEDLSAVISLDAGQLMC